MNINTSKEKSEYPEFNALKFIPWTKVMNYVDFWETYKSLVNNKNLYFNNSLSKDKANYIFLEIVNNQKLILWKLYNWSIIFNEWVSEMILSMLDSWDFTQIEDAIKLLLENDYSIHSELPECDDEIKNISVNCFNKSINDILIIDNNTKIEEWHDCFLIDEFNEKYPWLYALHSLNKNDGTIIQYNKWWEIIHIWFYYWDNILLLEWIDEKTLDELEMHAVISATLINKKIEKIIGYIWK